MERRRTATATGLYDSFYHIFFFLHNFSLHLFASEKSLNDEERGGNCLLVPERCYGPGLCMATAFHWKKRNIFSLFKCLCFVDSFRCCKTKYRNRNFEISNWLQTRSWGRGATRSRGQLTPTFSSAGSTYDAWPLTFDVFTCAQSVAVVIHSFILSLHSALASGAVYCNRSCLCVFGGRAGGVRTLLHPPSAFFIHSFFFS